METIQFTYLLNKQAKTLSVIVSEGRIILRPISDAMGLGWAKASRRLALDYGAASVKAPRGEALGLLPEDLDRWLTANASPANEVHTHFAKHLVPTVRQKSTELKVEEAVHAHAVAERKAEVTIIGRPLESPDIFRQQATRGGNENWVPAAIIEGAVRRKRLDTFRVIENIWTGDEEIVHVEMTIAPGASLNEFSRLHKAGELMTGPEMQAKYPTSPLLKRHTVAAHHFAEVDDATENPRGRIVLIPAQPSKFPWEKDLEAVPKPKGA